MIALSYGLGTLAALWALGGGDVAYFWQRQLVLAVALLILGLNVVWLQKRTALFKPNSATLMLAAGSALATAVPVVVLIWIGRHLDSVSVPMLGHTLALMRAPSFAAILVGSFLLAPAHEIISRGILSPAWGISGVAFLDALTVGFGLQLFIPFILYWLMGYCWGYLARQFGFMTALVSHTLWALIVLCALTYL